MPVKGSAAGERLSVMTRDGMRILQESGIRIRMVHIM